jgi:hypothetical protein
MDKIVDVTLPGHVCLADPIDKVESGDLHNHAGVVSPYQERRGLQD